MGKQVKKSGGKDTWLNLCMIHPLRILLLDPGASVAQLREVVGSQMKISSFFENGSTKENKPKDSLLFRQIGAGGRQKASGKTILGKPVTKSAEDESTMTCDEQKRVSKGENSDSERKNPHIKELSPKQTLVIPETQCLDSTSKVDSVSDDTSIVDNVISDDNDDSLIPDTPEIPAPSRPKPFNRSFLRPMTLLTKQPGLKTPPSKAEVEQIRRLAQLKRKKPQCAVSVTFNSSENGGKVLVNGNEYSSGNLLEKPDVASRSPESQNATSKSPTTPEERTTSRKRSAVPGISPSPKRASNKPMRSGEALSPIIFRKTTSSVSKGTCHERKSSTPKGRQHQLSSKQVKRLNSYQCSMQRKTNVIEDTSITCADDDVLADILGELHTQLNKSAPSKTHKTVKKNSPRIKNGETAIRKDVTSSLECKDDVSMETIPMVTSETVPKVTSDHVDKRISNSPKAMKGNELPDDEILSNKNFDANPDNDCSMDVAANLPTQSEELCEEFNSLSPFKVMSRSQEEPMYDPRSLTPPAEEFGRHRVTSVTFDSQRQELLLGVESSTDCIRRICHLQGFWCDTKVQEGDLVNILGVTFDPEGHCHITDSQGLIVVHPDRLISGTSVVSGVQCLRRSVLNEIFKGCDSSNMYMLYGSIIHSFFQEAVQKGVFESKKLTEVARGVMQQNKFLHEMYSQNATEDTVQAEVVKYIPPFQAWLQKFTNIGRFALGSQRPESGITVTKVRDIEENIWSPRFGVKGKIDLTVDVKIWGKSGKSETKVVPLELKTGKATYSAEHKGQVTLYSMMSSDRRDDPGQGLLLYLKEGSMQAISVNNANKGGLIQLRNDMSNYLHHRLQAVTSDDGKETHVIGRLPDPIHSRRTCEKCPQILNCAVYLRELEKREFSGGHPMTELIPATLSHLSAAHLNYFTDWCLMLELESAQGTGGKNVQEIWTLPATEREKSGDCLSGMVLSCAECVDSNQYILTFCRHHGHPSFHSAWLDKCGLSLNDTLVISAENKPLIALCMGICVSLTRDHIKISTDRDLSVPSMADLVYRLDKCDIFNTMGLYFTNLSRLMADNPVSGNLRRLLIDVDKPLFLPTMSKGVIEKVRSVFKSLNKPQKTAILKVLMSKDYILIKGYPGTGKTSTIVALVKILKLLGHSVLLASYTHSAVDNILLKLKRDGLKFLRLGRIARIHSAIHPFAAENLVKNLTSVADLRSFYAAQDIVATTCLGSNHVTFSQRKFDVCIVDEASQVLQPACLGPLFSADRFVLVGDHKQLPPVVQSREAKNLGMTDSLFSRLDTSGVTYELNLQYRMNSPIMELSNELIYGGALKCGNESVATSRLKLSAASEKLQKMSSVSWIVTSLSEKIEHAAIFLDTNKVPAPESKDSTGLIKNDVEAELVTVLVKAFVMAGVDPDEIGVIAPYRNQVKVIQSMLNSCNHGDIEVNTVDQYQGRDKSVIIISFVKSSTSDNAAAGELLKDIRRLNVAVTRAKHKLVLLGDRQTLNLYEPVLKILSVVEKNNQIIALPEAAHKDLHLQSS
ncbi:DNA replication ATP-dependent helicase/nuclease DNA2-like [Liolophura sinensis]|uniref:DNA replication ATP-dependent helicase/nuclease DNA2-like n=1 Tax=Liolophura sinensis TaxID=3198878 RepID=UPI0031580941